MMYNDMCYYTNLSSVRRILFGIKTVLHLQSTSTTKQSALRTSLSFASVVVADIFSGLLLI